MKDLAYAFTLCLATLGPTKTIPVFYLATRSADWRTVLALSAVKTLTSPSFAEAPPNATLAATGPQHGTSWLGRPVLAPLAVPGIVPPVGVMVVLLFAAAALGDTEMQTKLAGLLVFIMGLNFAAMLCARPIMRVVGVPVLQVTGWVFSALQAGLGVQAVISALRALQSSTGG